MPNRRDFLKTGAIAGAGALFAKGGFQKAVAGQKRRRDNSYTMYSYGATPPLDKWTEQLIAAIPVAAKTNNWRYSLWADYYEIDMKGGRWQFHTQLPVTSPKKFTTWGYGSSNFFIGYLGPTIEAKKGKPVVVKFANLLPEFHPVQQAIDPTVPEVEIYGIMPGGRATPHLHGGLVPPQYDGHPHSWFTNFQSHRGGRAEHGTHYDTLDNPANNEAIFYYPNNQAPAGLWYHDHAMGVTRLNAYVGLAALYFIRDNKDTGLATNPMKLPAGIYEVPIVLQDKTFNADGSLFYPTAGVTIEHPIWMPEFFGDTPVINGKCYPNFNVEARRYRFRFVNGSQARFYNITIPGGLSGNVPMWQIGAEQGFLPAPANVSDGLLIAPGERADVIVDFTGLNGNVLAMNNDAPVPYDGGGGGPDIPQLMQFRVGPMIGSDNTLRGNSVALLPVTPLVATLGAPKREIVLKEDTAPTIDGTDVAPSHVRLNQRWFDEIDPLTGKLIIDEAPKVGDTEIWQYVNLTVDYHPMHSHLVAFQVVNREEFDSDGYETAYLAWVAANRPPANKPVLANYLLGEITLPAPNETGFKDTVQCPPSVVTRVIAKYDLPPAVPLLPGTRTTLPAQYVYHCHILEHEENEMMRTFCVTSNGVPPTNLPPGMWKPGVTAATTPTQFALEQNYPNPFNPETTLGFALPEDSHVLLKVYNALGQEVTTLVDADYAAGSHVVNWNASNFASGVYFAKIKAGSFVSARRMMLVK